MSIYCIILRNCPRSLTNVYSYKLSVTISQCNCFKRTLLTFQNSPSYICANYCHTAPVNPKCWETYLDFNDAWDSNSKDVLVKDMVVLEDFLTNEEEESIWKEVEPYMSKLHYEFDHWDDAIHGYRETERLKWNDANTTILQRVRETAFPPGTPQLSLVHVLDLAEDGLIKPHIDSVRFCGNTIAGLSLLSNSVMRLVLDKNKEQVADVLLKRRSLYIMKGIARYDFTHEILGNKHSSFKEEVVFKARRVSVICRNEP